MKFQLSHTNNTPGGTASGFDEDQKLTIAFPAVRKALQLDLSLKPKTKPYIPGPLILKLLWNLFTYQKCAREIYSERLFTERFLTKKPR